MYIFVFQISTKEPWERNTRYYWRQIVVVILGGLIAMMWSVYGRGPGLSNAFKNHWLVETPTVLGLKTFYKPQSNEIKTFSCHKKLPLIEIDISYTN